MIDARCEITEGKRVLATLPPGAEVMLPSTRRFDVSSAGQLPQALTRVHCTPRATIPVHCK
ncbi:MAG: hypothetical protein CM15mP74_06850 [Halieaceae bacterium]|nr:MAG: hypothetical protein CM15mP74_06850 [Halieaceae bacterium]